MLAENYIIKDDSLSQDLEPHRSQENMSDVFDLVKQFQRLGRWTRLD